MQSRLVNALPSGSGSLLNDNQKINEVNDKAIQVETTFWPEQAKFKMSKATVTKVIDGETIIINKTEPVRLLGITAKNKQEKRQRIYYPIDEAQAKAYLEKLVLNKTVYIEQNSEMPKNHNGEIIAYVWIGDAKKLNSVNAMLVQEGLVKTKRMKDITVYDESFKDLENQAIQLEKGIWGRVE